MPEITTLADPIKAKHPDTRSNIFNHIARLANKEGQQNVIALAISAAYYSEPAKTGLGSKKTSALLYKFYIDHYQNEADGEFFLEVGQNLRRFVTRKTDKPFQQQHESARQQTLTVLLLFVIALLNARCGPDVRKHPYFRHFISTSPLIQDAQAIIENPEGAEEYLANENMEVMRSFSEIAKKAFKIEDMSSKAFNEIYFSDGSQERNFLCYRYAAKQSDIENPILIKSFMKVKNDLSTTARMIHFYNQKAEQFNRRTNGGLIELKGTVYFFGASSELDEASQPGPARGLKMVAAGKQAIDDNPRFFSGVVLTTNKNFSPLVAKIAFVETNIDDSRKIALGRTEIKELADDKQLWCDNSKTADDLLDLLKVDSTEFAIRP